MLIFYSKKSLEQFISEIKQSKKSIGFVPTMGALHQGHISLLEKSFGENDFTICSIFVNPLQFNNKEDLDKYPRDIESDCQKIHRCCDAVFIPKYEDIYPEEPKEVYEFGNLDILLEGKFRPGHFYGVAAVVKRFFEIINPDKAYFGLKDFQQLQVIKSMVKQFGLSVEIVSCDIIREIDGLAMSSRNQRLSSEQRQIAPIIHTTLNIAAEILKENGVSASKEFVFNTFAPEKQFRMEYFEWVDTESFQIVSNPSKNMVGLIAVWLGNIRLIDNILISF